MKIYNTIKFCDSYSIGINLASTNVEQNRINTCTKVRHSIAALSTVGFLGTGIGYPFSVKHFSTSKIRQVEQDKGKRKATEQELEQMELENQKNRTEITPDLDEQENKDMEKAIEESRKGRKFTENSSNLPDEQLDNSNIAGPSVQQQDSSEVADIPSVQANSSEIEGSPLEPTENPDEQSDKSESKPELDTLEKFADTPGYQSDYTDQVDPEYPYDKGMEAECNKSRVVWKDLNNMTLDEPNKRGYADFLEEQKIRHEEARDMARDPALSEAERKFHEGRATAIQEMISEGTEKWLDLGDERTEIMRRADEGLPPSPSPSDGGGVQTNIQPLSDEEEEPDLFPESSRNSQEPTQEEPGLFPESSQNNQEPHQHVEMEENPVPENAEAENDSVLENVEAKSESDPEDAKADDETNKESDKSKKRKRDSDDEGDGPSGGGVSPESRGTDGLPLPNWGSNSNQKVIIWISSIMSFICDAFDNLPF